MIRRQEGFTLVELMVTMVIFVVVIVAASNIFSGLLNQFKQQSKIAETNIEGLVGLDMLRIDVQQAGFGIPWNLESTGDNSGDDDWSTLGANYSERVSNAGFAPFNATYYNDGWPASLAPRGILAEDNAGPVMGTGASTWSSDYLVVKSTSIGIGAAAQKWTHITNNGAVNLAARVWNDPNEDLVNTDRVIVERPTMGAGGAQQRVLVMAVPPAFSTQFNAAFEPDLDTFDTHLVYGVDPDTNLSAPFNRADFYVGPAANMPSQCAPNTGILYKAVMNQNGGSAVPYPLLDCVADMQVVFITYDPDNPSTPPVWENAHFPFTAGGAAGIRDQIRGVVIYILAQEGQMDRNFTFTNFSAGCVGVANCMRVGDRDGATLRGREFDLSWIDPNNFANYRWKVYTIAVQLVNLR